VRSRVNLALVAPALVALVACGQQQRAASSGCATGAGITRAAVTQDYRYLLSVGPTETMYTRAQNEAKHPKTGEVMLRGTMAMSMKMAANVARHLEVHICSRHTGAVVTNGSPTITFHDLTASKLPMAVPVTVMRGVRAGPSDIHYGNNVSMTAGHGYRIVVVLGDQDAAFAVRLPKSLA
jgi:hypothetical protein